jgi:hypothetical protein
MGTDNMKGPCRSDRTCLAATLRATGALLDDVIVSATDRLTGTWAPALASSSQLDGLQHEQRLYGLPPQGRFVAAEAPENSAVVA